MPNSHTRRLPSHVRPTRYEILITPNADMTTFEGVVSVELDTLTPTVELVCNSRDLVITHAALNIGGQTSTLSRELDSASERLILRSETMVPAGHATLEIAFNGVINDSLLGFYRSTFTIDDRPSHIGVTQFEAPYARMAFPCWDEPDFKAVFSVTIAAPSHLTVVSNEALLEAIEEDGITTHRFADTIPMSTYLVAWVIGEFEISEPRYHGNVPIRVAYPRSQTAATEFALDVAAHSLQWFEEYYGIPYPASKLDLIAIPDFTFGAMENLGCVTFREILVLVDPERTTRAEQELAALVISHEIAHMWFGDLVTMEWWNGIWLNEAFATFMELSCIDAYRPDWQVWNTFVAQRARAFDTDALVRTRPIEFEVNTPSEADAMFDVLTYEKGAAVLRMFEQWAGPDNFREGVRSYLQTHQYANTDATDLWAALSEATGTDVTSMMNTWILQGGHPLITAAVDGADVAVSQLPMTYLAAEDRASLARTWVVPARIRTIDVHGAVSDVSVELASNAVTIHGQAPIAALDLNHGSSGFYRQLVDPRFELAEAFRPDQLAPADRATRIDNATALLLAQRATPQHLLDTLRWFAPTEQHPLVWRVIAKSLDTLAMLAGPISLPSIARFAQGLLEPARSVQRPTTEEGRETDALLLRLAGTVANDPAAITESLEVFERQIRGETVDPDLAEAAFMVTGAHGGPDATQRLLTAFREAPTPQERLRALDAMGATRNPERLEAFCRLCLTEVRTQDAATALTRAMGQRPLGPQVWTYVERNWKALDERLPTASFDRLPAGIRAFGEPGFVASTTSFLDEHPRPQAAVAISQHLERAAVNARCRQAVGVELNKALDAPNPAS